jgi:hypothetical protein
LQRRVRSAGHNLRIGYCCALAAHGSSPCCEQRQANEHCGHQFPGETLGTVCHKNGEGSPKRPTRQRPRMPECCQKQEARSLFILVRRTQTDTLATKIAVGAKRASGWTADAPYERYVMVSNRRNRDLDGARRDENLVRHSSRVLY